MSATQDNQRATQDNQLVLGTVQLGLEYGVANRTGKPSREQAFEILETAWQNRVRTFDTASAYGGSQVVLGDFIQAHGLEGEVGILTKVDSLYQADDWPAKLRADVEQAFEQLHCEAIQVLFLHSTQDLDLLLQHPERFQELLAALPVRRLGVSIYLPEEAERVRQAGLDVAYQFPANLVDRRFARLELPEGQRYARSILQQGLLAATTISPQAPAAVQTLFARLQERFTAQQLEPLAAALAYARTAAAFDYFLIGVETRPQLEEILQLLEQPVALELPDDAFDDLFDWEVFDPRRWG